MTLDISYSAPHTTIEKIETHSNILKMQICNLEKFKKLIENEGAKGVLNVSSAIRDHCSSRLFPANKDQKPDLIVVSSHSIDLTSILYNGNPKIKNGIQYEGVFGSVLQVSNPKMLEKFRDSPQFDYMIQHLMHSKEPKFPFIGVFGAIDSFSSKSLTRDIISLRDRKLDFTKELSEISKMKYDDEKGLIGITLSNANDINFYELPIVSIILNKSDSKFYVYDEKFENAILFSKWAENVSFVNNDIILKMAKQFLEIEKIGGLLDILKHSKTCKSIRCVDSRTFRMGEITTQEKLLGGIMSKIQIEDMLKMNSTQIFHYDFHTSCGYITSAVKIYILLKELLKSEDSSVKNDIIRELEKAFSDPTYKMKLNQYYLKYAMEPSLYLDSNEKIKLFNSLFGQSPMDLQNILLHMVEVGVITFNKSEGRINMSSYEHIGNLIKERKLMVPFDHFVYLITEELLRKQAEDTKKIYEKLAKKNIIQGDITLYLSMTSLADHQKYNILETAEESVLSPIRKNQRGESKTINQIING